MQNLSVSFFITRDEAAGVPDLVGEVTHGLAALGVETHIVAGGVAGDEVEAQSVAAVLVDHLQRIDAVAQRLGHLAALIITHQTVDEHSVEGSLLRMLTAGEDHAGHPEGDNVVAGDQHVGGIEILQVLALLIGPAQSGEGPEGGAHVLETSYISWH